MINIKELFGYDSGRRQQPETDGQEHAAQQNEGQEKRQEPEVEEVRPQQPQCDDRNNGQAATDKADHTNTTTEATAETCGETASEPVVEPEGVTPEEPHRQQQATPITVKVDNSEVLGQTERIINALRSSIANQKAIHNVLTQQIGLLQEQNERLTEQNRQLTEVVRNQHETIAKFQNDVFYRAQKDVIMEIIHIADEVQAITDGCEKANPMHAELTALGDFIDKGLTFSAVRSFRHADGCSNEFNPKCQEFDDTTVVTDDPAKDRNIVSVRPGYVWTMPWLVANTDVQLQNFIRDNAEPKRFEFVIRPELVARMAYCAPATETE